MNNKNLPGCEIMYHVPTLEVSDMAKAQTSRKADANSIYKQYVKPLEQRHKGEYVVVTPDGQTIFGADLMSAVLRAQQISAQDNYIFKVGDRILGKLR